MAYFCVTLGDGESLIVKAESALEALLSVAGPGEVQTSTAYPGCMFVGTTSVLVPLG